AGVPGLIQEDMIKSGVVLLDAGTSSSKKTIVGDIADDCARKAALFSKTPGGIGPVTVAVLFRNLVVSLI
ncbi:MAG: bifunctional 5,10-methylenetetrahydrofolate dehydrogenase/5,10-methenyltetrahydrofolate cyclohydrolase, partial [bacterium]|nr:bifunctional 5,10-methylenetetrahydrofolate dehydrogenase/5,10-methenyltetrahydrofolate cyclohydrolase [bacterium]